MDRDFDFIDALESLRPESEWSILGNDYSSLQWMDQDSFPPTEKELLDEIENLKMEWKKTEYARLREQEYPDFRDYLDGIVKGDEHQINEYIEKCLEVKQKYPKPD